MLQLAQAPAPHQELMEDSPRRREFRRRSDPTAEIRWRVGTALDTNPEFVKVEHSCISQSGSTLHCTGRVRATRFSAKIYLVDLYPVSRRFTVPGEELRSRTEVYRPVEEQVATEWKRVQQIQSLTGSRNSPTPLGYSLEGRTLVFEEVTGVPADRLARPTWPGTTGVRSAESALFQAGAWLKKLHQASLDSFETVTPIDFLEHAHRTAGMRDRASTAHEKLAFQPLEAVCRQIGPRTPVRVPIALNHGDFSLPNLVWEGTGAHLWVLDFGLSSVQSILHDLGMMILDLRMRLLHPLTSQRSIRRFEQAFWSGYGNVATNLRLLVNAVAGHRLFCHAMQRMRSLRTGLGWIGEIKSRIYGGLLQPYLMSRILNSR